MKQLYTCNFCGKQFERDTAHVKGKRYIFCSRRCLWDFSSKNKNPEGYAALKDFTNMARHFSELNRKLNPTRMTPETKEKIRNSHLGTGEDKTYSKFYGRHEHRVVAEQILGRALGSEEVVHHIDGNPRNNQPENLFVFSSQADHAAHHKFLELVLS